MQGLACIDYLRRPCFGERLRIQRGNAIHMLAAIRDKLQLCVIRDERNAHVFNVEQSFAAVEDLLEDWLGILDRVRSR